MNRIFPGRGARVSESMGLRTLALDPPSPWKHPWFTTPRWNGSAWEATVVPGFVNGRAASITRTETLSVNDDPRDFGINPLTGQPFFSAPVFNSQLSTLNSQPGTQQVNVPLYLNPAVELEWEAIGFDGSNANNGVPQFFLDRGAAQFPGTNDSVGFDGTTVDSSGNIATANAPDSLRLLRKCDIILHQPRLAIGQQTLNNGTTLLGIVPPATNDVLKVYAGQFEQSEAEIDNPAANDQPFDETIVSRVYALSPPNTALDSMPDGSWQCYVAHSLFWNLNWAQAQLPASTFTGQPDAAGIQALGQVLAGGVAAADIDALSSITSLGLQGVSLSLATNTLAGTFWTPTGGGVSAQFPIATADLQAGLAGLNKSGLLQAERLANLQQIAGESLDPEFPYVGLPFPVNLLPAST